MLFLSRLTVRDLFAALHRGTQKRRHSHARRAAAMTSVTVADVLETRTLLSAVSFDTIRNQVEHESFEGAGIHVDPPPESSFTSLIVVGESPNNSVTGAQQLPLGTDPGEDTRVRVNGSFQLTPTNTIATAEENGSIDTATNLQLFGGDSVRVSSLIGDGTQAASTGDFDFFELFAVAGETITIDVDAQTLGSNLDAIVGLYDANGVLVASNAGTGALLPTPEDLDPFLEFTTTTQGLYYVAIGGGDLLPLNANDATSGPGVASTGTYDLLVGIDAVDRDFFEIELNAGDTFSAGVAGANTIRLLDRFGNILFQSSQNLSFIYPASSPLVRTGDAAFAKVIAQSDTYFVEVLDTTTTTGDYTLDLGVDRPILEGQPVGTKQILFLDFDGGLIDTSIWGGVGVRNFQPLISYLDNFGLDDTPEFESQVIDAVIASVTENLIDDVRARGLNPAFDVEILNSRDHADPFGLPNVSRVIIGGSIADVGINTIGISESIDIGNFDTTESAFVLLDLLLSDQFGVDGLLEQFVGPNTNRVDLIGTAVGNIATHEAGHFFGAFHTDQFNSTPGIMDQGGNLPQFIGVGPDGIFGTADDIDVDFVTDSYVPNEGFIGLEDTLNAIAFGLTAGTVVQPDLDIDNVGTIDFNAGQNRKSVFPDVTVTDATQANLDNGRFRAVNIEANRQRADEIVIGATARVQRATAVGQQVLVDGVSIGIVERISRSVIDVRMNATATPDRVAALGQAIKFAAIDAGPARTIRLAIDNGNGQFDFADATVNVVGGTFAPDIRLGGTRAARPGQSILVSPTSGLSDRDSNNFDGGFLDVALLAVGRTADDQVRIDFGNRVTRTGNTVLVDGVAIGTITFDGRFSKRIALNANATKSRMIRVLNATRYIAGATDGQRTVRFLLDDGDGRRGTARQTVTVSAANVFSAFAAQGQDDDESLLAGLTN